MEDTGREHNDITNLKLVGFDPASTKNLGWSIVSYLEGKLDCTAGTFIIPDFDEPWKALWPMYLSVDQLLIEQQPDVVVVEKTSVFRGGFITGQVAGSIGSILIACGKNDLTVEFVYPTHVKKVITGKGQATKSQMKDSVKKILARFEQMVKFDSEHSCDATANVLSFLSDNGVIDLSEGDDAK